jgi:20S proteasome subunit beta 3
MAYNGGTVVAMTGKNCIAIASDKRFGVQYSTVSMEFPKVFEMGPHLFLGLAGLTTDVQTVYEFFFFH